MFNEVLFVAPIYTRKGGIASVLKTYKDNINSFNFFASIYFSNKVVNLLIFPFVLFYYIVFLLFKPSIKIIHIHGASRGSFYRKYFIFKISKFLNKKVVYHMHGGKFHIFYNDSSKSNKKRIENFINKSDALIVLSTEWSKYFTTKFNQKKINILNNIVPFQNNIDKKIDKKIKLLFLGRINNNKGIYDLLNVISKNKEFYNNKITLAIGGDGETVKLKKFISKNKLEKIVAFYGWTKAELKNKLLLESHIMILPSYNEGLPITLLEAMSYSMPLISTHVGGISRILNHKENGIVVKPGDLYMIDNAIKYYIDNKDKIAIHGENSYNIVKDFYPKTVLNSLLNIYKKIN